jgi:multidrug resistance efflux pump
MWPKVLAQLFELLPHIARVVPMADKYFSSKANTEKATETAMVAMAEGLRGDLGQVTKAHAGLYKELQEQSAQIAEITNEVRQVKEALERAMVLASQTATLGRWVKYGVSLIVVLLIAVIALLVRGR